MSKFFLLCVFLNINIYAEDIQEYSQLQDKKQENVDCIKDIKQDQKLFHPNKEDSFVDHEDLKNNSQKEEKVNLIDCKKEKKINVSLIENEDNNKENLINIEEKKNNITQILLIENQSKNKNFMLMVKNQYIKFLKKLNNLRFNNLVAFEKLNLPSCLYFINDNKIYCFGYLNKEQHHNFLKLAYYFFDEIYDFLEDVNDLKQYKIDEKFTTTVKNQFFIDENLKNKVNLYIIGQKIFLLAFVENEQEKEMITKIFNLILAEYKPKGLINSSVLNIVCSLA